MKKNVSRKKHSTTKIQSHSQPSIETLVFELVAEWELGVGGIGLKKKHVMAISHTFHITKRKTPDFSGFLLSFFVRIKMENWLPISSFYKL